MRGVRRRDRHTRTAIGDCRNSYVDVSDVERGARAPRSTPRAGVERAAPRRRAVRTSRDTRVTTRAPRGPRGL
jgi:hypothetical protein